MNTQIPVLQKGFVQLVDHFGSDLSVVNAARVSMGKSKTEFDNKDARLIRYLARHHHTTPFRHASATFRVKLPIFVARQWMKHSVGSSYNEMSMRYVDASDLDIYVPSMIRTHSEDIKQGSGGYMPSEFNRAYRMEYIKHNQQCINLYKELLEAGACREQARAVLPVGVFTEFIWTATLESITNFVVQRTDNHAQFEIQLYAHAIDAIMKKLYPHSYIALRNKFVDKYPERWS